jgi:molecular chaperone DnaK (HSP70)
VVVGSSAKRRIDTHPHHTVYNAKRVLGRSPSHDAISELKNEVEFGIVESDDTDGVLFRIPHQESKHSVLQISMQPQQVGSYVVNYLIDITKEFLGHDMVKSAVICVPAKFDTRQRQATVQAFKDAGVSVTRILEEPTAAALAYGLHKKEGVEYILVYDFGGGTLDVSLLHVTEGFADVMGSDGDDQLGGADFDAAVAHYLLEQRGGQGIVDRVASSP